MVLNNISFYILVFETCKVLTDDPIRFVSKFYVTNIYLQSKLFTKFNLVCRLIIFMKIKTTFCYFLTLYIVSGRCFDPKLDFNLIGCLTVRWGTELFV